MGRFDGQLMWLVDFLANEGFDATRISVFAATNWECQGKDRHESKDTGNELSETLCELLTDGCSVCFAPHVIGTSSDLA
jgi:hypothetical protein